MKQLKDYIEKFNCIVSTVYAYDVQKYETMILTEGKNTLYGTKYTLAQRYETEEEAIKGHSEVIQNILNGKKYDGKDEIFDNLSSSQLLTFLIKSMIDKEK